ncbi:thiamine diphosphate-binding protein [Dactylonectria macrodidyma]|uniref:Thiamine diphosphate-binding protein n=1 Tax=Dactylonectria macrodidyma TaxID=307937 RepID=A0A9P9IUT4_9HYPO|nr:thiamine diphosphate-binding protein [Dactylonectria macrodidyma]
MPCHHGGLAQGNSAPGKFSKPSSHPEPEPEPEPGPEQSEVSRSVPRAAQQAALINRPGSRQAAGSCFSIPESGLLHHGREALASVPDLPHDGPSIRLNLCQLINSALRTALGMSDRDLCFGEDVAFGGVFRSTLGLQSEFGPQRVFNMPITEQGIVGVAIGAAAEGMKPVVKIPFADYVFPAFGQIVNEAAKFRYREGVTGANLGGLAFHMACGGVGHGALYNTQSPESLVCYVSGFLVVMPRSPPQEKGLLLASIMDSKDSTIFLELKILYRAAVKEVPD